MREYQGEDISLWANALKKAPNSSPEPQFEWENLRQRGLCIMGMRAGSFNGSKNDGTDRLFF